MSLAKFQNNVVISLFINNNKQFPSLPTTPPPKKILIKLIESVLPIQFLLRIMKLYILYMLLITDTDRVSIIEIY